MFSVCDCRSKPKCSPYIPTKEEAMAQYEWFHKGTWMLNSNVPTEPFPGKPYKACPDQHKTSPDYE